MFEFFKSRRRKKLLEQAMSSDWLRTIDRNVEIFSALSDEEQTRLLTATRIITAERPFVGSGGMTITDEVRVTIAAQSALLLLGESGYYFDRVPTIFVYPHIQTTKKRLALTTAHLVEEDVAIQGQVLEQGEIRLSWDEVLYGCHDTTDGENVVLHEFAHHLDRLDGEMGGTPPLTSREQRQNWTRVFDGVLAQLRSDLSAGRDTFLEANAAENRAELFAYSTECYFEQPHDLAELHPDLFDCLLSFYKTDPRPWFLEDGGTERQRDREI